jgi:hypothetical protein
MTDFEFHFFLFAMTTMALGSLYYIRAGSTNRRSLIALCIATSIFAVPMWIAKAMAWLQ